MNKTNKTYIETEVLNEEYTPLEATAIKQNRTIKDVCHDLLTDFITAHAKNA